MQSHSLPHPERVRVPGQPTGEHLQKLIDSTMDVICSVDGEGCFLTVSAASVSLWGYPPEELVGKPYIDIVLEEDRPKTIAIAEQIMNGKKISFFENRFVRKDGTPVPLHWSAQWDETDRIMFSIARDASDRKKKEEIQVRQEREIKRQHEDMLEILERITDGFFALDKDWRFRFGNSQVERMLDKKWEDYLNRNYWECFPDMVGSIYDREFHRAKNENVPVHFEDYFPPFNRWFSVDAYPSDTGLSVFFRDITGQKEEEARQKAYEDKIREQNEMMVEVLEKMTDGFLTIRLDGKVIYWNGEAERISGISRDLILGRKIWELFPGFESTGYYETYLQLKDHPGDIHKEVFSPYLKRWVELHAYTTRNGISVFFRDIAEKKRAEEELQKLSIITREMSNPVWLMDAALRVIWVNEAFTRTYGYTAEEAIGKFPHELFTGPETDGNTVRDMQRNLEEGKTYRCEMVNYTKGKEKIIVQLTCQPLFDDQGRIFRYFTIQVDLTEKKKVEEELKKLSRVASATKDAVIITGMDQKITWVNEAFTQMSGYTAAEAMGKFPEQLLNCPETDPESLALLREKANRGEPVCLEMLNRTKANGRVWWEVYFQPVYNEKGILEQYFSVSIDVTEKKRLQQKLEEEQLKQQHLITAAVIAAQEKERAQVGLELHDNVNQVLTTVKLYTELVRDGIVDRGEIADKSVRLLQESINEIRSLSKRLSAPALGNIKLKDSIAELIEVVDATAKLKVSTDLSGIEELEVGQEVHLAIYRILQEHLTNILKHAQAKEVEVKLDFMEGTLFLEVTDNGNGFDPAQKSTGIGITNMSTRAEALKGTFLLQSAPGKGCTLEVKLPL